MCKITWKKHKKQQKVTQKCLQTGAKTSSKGHCLYAASKIAKKNGTKRCKTSTKRHKRPTKMCFCCFVVILCLFQSGSLAPFARGWGQGGAFVCLCQGPVVSQSVHGQSENFKVALSNYKLGQEHPVRHCFYSVHVCLLCRLCYAYSTLRPINVNSDLPLQAVQAYDSVLRLVFFKYFFSFILPSLLQILTAFVLLHHPALLRFLAVLFQDYMLQKSQSAVQLSTSLMVSPLTYGLKRLFSVSGRRGYKKKKKKGGEKKSRRTSVESKRASTHINGDKNHRNSLVDQKKQFTTLLSKNFINKRTNGTK